MTSDIKKSPCYGVQSCLLRDVVQVGEWLANCEFVALKNVIGPQYKPGAYAYPASTGMSLEKFQA